MIKSLRLINWRKHRNLYLDFTEGLNLLVGSNWAGKSSALSAIPFALFGTRATPGTAADLTTHGESGMEVALTFEAGGGTYQVVRSLKSASLTKRGDETPMATGNTPVTAEIEHLIGVSMRDFLDFQVTRQGEADGLLASGPTKLADFVARVTGVDVIDAAQERIKGELQLCKGALLGLPEPAEPVTALKTRLGEAQKVHLDLVAKKVWAEEEADKAALESADASALAKTQREQVTAASEARRKRDLASHDLEIAEGRYSNSLEALGEALEIDAAELAKEQAHLRDLESNLALRKDQEARLSTLFQALEAAKAQVTSLGACLAGVELLDESNALVRHEALLDERKLAEHTFSQAQQAAESSMCPYCMRAFEDLDQDQLSKALGEAKSKFISAQEASDDAWDELGDIRNKNAETAARKDSLAAWATYQKMLEEEHNALKQGLAPAVDQLELEVLTVACAGKTDLLARYRALEHERDQASDRVDWAMAALAHCQVPDGPSEEETVAAEEVARKASESAWRALHEATEAKAATAAQKSVVEVLEAALKQAEEVVERRGYFVAREAGFQELGKFLRGNRDRFTAAFWDQLLGYASTMIQEATSGAVTRLSRNAAGEFVYEEAGREITVEGSASGMQRAIFSTAIKLSLAAAVGSPFPVMLFDEVTAAAQDEVSLQFTSLLASAGKQVIMVTHREADAAAADHVLVLG